MQQLKLELLGLKGFRAELALWDFARHLHSLVACREFPSLYILFQGLGRMPDTDQGCLCEAPIS